jgi:aminoglycoside 3-N-acetyltransferase I
MTSIRAQRLTTADAPVARRLFLLIARVFEEPVEPLSDVYLARLLSRPEFWAIAAFAGDDLIGGLTAHTLPMTSSESSEIFIYDIAVRADHRRRGVGRQLVTALRAAAAAEGVEDIFVPADNEDTHALDFYRALGGEPSAVTHFTFRGRVEE